MAFIRKDQWNRDLYDYPDNHKAGKLPRMLSVRTNYKDIPVLHIYTNLINAGISKDDFDAWMKLPKNKKKKRP